MQALLIFMPVYMFGQCTLQLVFCKQTPVQLSFALPVTALKTNLLVLGMVQ